jgi:hypothetical protein
MGLDRTCCPTADPRSIGDERMFYMMPMLRFN